MRILLIVTKAELGGAQSFVIDLAKQIREKGHEVSVALGDTGNAFEVLKNENIDTFTINNLARTKNPLRNLLYILEIKKLQDKKSFDIVHFNSSNALFGAIGIKLSKNKAKSVFTYHGLSVLDPNYKLNLLSKYIYRYFFSLMMKFIDRSVFVCRDNLEYIKSIGIKTKASVVYNGVNHLDFFPKEKALKKISKRIGANLENKFLLGSIGRLSYQKNYEFIISIFPKILKKYPNIALLIIGDGENEKSYRNLIKKNKLNDKVFLFGSAKDAYKYIPAFDLFTLVSRYEGMSITIIEALFAHVPILVSDVGGNKETLRMTDKQLFTLDSRDDFIHKLSNIHDSDKLQKTLRDVNFDFSEKFTTKKMTQGYLEIYKSLTEN
ncbi:hypothetical protein C0584_03110 [Candidatus Parcubacteria bacterium]|nr:MAG: hypothetical protein C0584_03110 [Candidatus Parcubacteria bacterium]